MKIKKNLWGKKSKTFPVYDESDVRDMAFINGVIHTAEGRMAGIAGKSVIDIGCGTGRYTFRLARCAKSVCGTDISEDMIEVLRRTGEKYGFGNVTVSICDWKEADMKKKGWAGNFDVAWAAMTGAINTKEDVVKMNSCAREWCACVAWGRRRENPALEDVFSAHGSELKVPPGEKEITKALEELGLDYSVDRIDDFWRFEGTREEVAADLEWHLEMGGLVPAADRIGAALEKYNENGIYYHEMRMETSVITWKVKR